jgi:hypothetical protein
MELIPRSVVESYDLQNAEGAAKFFDDHGPDRWYWEINTLTLNQDSYDLCVLAHLYGDYGTGRDTLNIPPYMAAFDGRVPAQDWINEVMNRRAEDAVEEDNIERENEVEEFVRGKKYKVTTVLEYDSHYSGDRYVFRDMDGDLIAVPEAVTTIEPAPWEVRSGDVYKRGNSVFVVQDATVHGGTLAVGSIVPLATADLGFTEDELIHRAS